MQSTPETFVNILSLYSSDIICTVFFSFFSLVLEYVHPTIREIPLDDKSISFPFVKHEIISAFMLPLFYGVIPAIVIVCVMAINRYRNRRLLVAFFGLYLSVTIAFLLTNIMKSAVGKLRPDFLSRCDFDPITSTCKSSNARLILEGRRSFPSGHASTSFGGLVFIALFLAGQFRTFDGSSYIYKLIIVLLPMLTATLVAISRIIDHRHHWEDVFCGSLFGCLSAFSSYFYLFPSVFSESCSSPRTVRFDKLELELEDSRTSTSTSTSARTETIREGEPVPFMEVSVIKSQNISQNEIV